STAPCCPRSRRPCWTGWPAAKRSRRSRSALTKRAASSTGSTEPQRRAGCRYHWHPNARMRGGQRGRQANRKEANAMDVLAGVLTALVGGPGQHDRLLRLHTPLGPEVLVAESLDAHEAVGPSPDGVTGYRLALTALSVDAHIDLAELLGQPVLLELLTDVAGVHRPFHGHVTAFERIGSNGGLARYRLVVEPWLALLRQRVDSFVFQDLTVPEIVESVFADHVDAGGKLVPAWRWDLADPTLHRKRSLATQFEESDLAFVERLLADEGLYYWFEHEGAPGDDTL